MSLTKLFLAGNNLIIPGQCLVRDIPAGDGKIANLFVQFMVYSIGAAAFCTVTELNSLKEKLKKWKSQQEESHVDNLTSQKPKGYKKLNMKAKWVVKSVQYVNIQSTLCSRKGCRSLFDQTKAMDILGRWKWFYVFDPKLLRPYTGLPFKFMLKTYTVYSTVLLALSI